MTVLTLALAMFFYFSGLLYVVVDGILQYRNEPILKWRPQWRYLIWPLLAYQATFENRETILRVLTR